ncbi:MAG: Gfo/Idh/MocA family oxidoreductase [Chloroflexi bacterium]|nr:Gfo/Idh/MocA family oxidoreductase [Chloroflexota bacterium]
MDKSQLHGALIGAGAVTVYHLKAWEQISQASIVAIADPDLDAAYARGDEFGIPRQHIYPSFEALLESERELDFVDIATLPDTHLELVKLVAERKLHITCQKPFAYSLREARQMIAICERAGILFNIHENWRWRRWYREIKKMLDAGEIGLPVYAKFFIHTDYWVNPERRTGLRKKAHGTLMEWGIHHIDLMRYLFGEAESVYARMRSAPGDNLVIDRRALAVLNFRSGVTAYLDMSSASFSVWGNVNRDGPMVEDARIEGASGTILLIPDPERGDLLRIVTAADSSERPVYSGTPQSVYQASYTAAHQHFIDCLLSGEMTETGAQDNLETLAVTLAAYHSSKKDQVVTIEDYKRLDS